MEIKLNEKDIKIMLKNYLSTKVGLDVDVSKIKDITIEDIDGLHIYFDNICFEIES